MKRHKPPLFNLPLYILLQCILKPSSHILQILSGRTKINKNKNQQSYCISSICHKIRYSYINANKKSRTRTSEVIKELGVVTFCLDAIMKQKITESTEKAHSIHTTSVSPATLLVTHPSNVGVLVLIPSPHIENHPNLSSLSSDSHIQN